MKNIKLFMISMLVIMLGYACQKDNETSITPINPETEPSRLCKALIVQGQNKSGDIPAATPDAPEIINSQATATVAADASMYIPFEFSTDFPISGIYLTVIGADSHWDIPATPAGNSGQYVFGIGIPAHVLPGNFEITYRLYDENGNVGQPKTLSTELKEPERLCDTTGVDSYYLNGSSGLTTSVYELGNTTGTVSISYQTYSLPDRLDIEYNGQFVASTGDILTPGSAPPSSVCYDGTNGFVGGQSTLSFNYDPSVSKQVTVHVFGCLGNTTAWNYTISCP